MDEERFEEFASLISGIHSNIQKLMARYADSLGLKAVHVFWLYLLRTHPEGMTASELAAAAKADRSLVSREIDALLKAGIVRTLTDGERPSATDGIVADAAAAMTLLSEVGRRTWNANGDGCTVHSAVYNLTQWTMLWVPNEHYDDPDAVFAYSFDKPFAAVN